MRIIVSPPRVNQIQLLVIVTAAFLLSAACHVISTARILADTWDTGQHRNCLFWQRNLYCVEASQWKLSDDSSVSSAPTVTPYTFEKIRKRTSSIVDPERMARAGVIPSLPRGGSSGRWRIRPSESATGGWTPLGIRLAPGRPSLRLSRARERPPYLHC